MTSLSHDARLTWWIKGMYAAAVDRLIGYRLRFPRKLHLA